MTESEECQALRADLTAKGWAWTLYSPHIRAGVYTPPDEPVPMFCFSAQIRRAEPPISVSVYALTEIEAVRRCIAEIERCSKLPYQEGFGDWKRVFY